MKISGVVTLALLAAGLAGCASTMQNAVRNRATFDLNCPADQLQLVDLGGRVYGVRGCGRQASYLLRGECSTQGSCQAIMNSEAGQPPK